MKKLLLFSLVFLFLIGSVQALPSISTLPPNISLECGNNYNEAFSLDGTQNNNITFKTQGAGSSYFMTLEKILNTLRVSFFQMGTSCSIGSSTFSFKLDGVLYEIELVITDTLFQLKQGFPLLEGQKFSIGNTIHFNLINVGNGFVDYSLEGCGSLDELTLYYGNVLDKICGTERLEVEIDEILGGEVATFNISFSSPSLNVQKSDSDTNDGSPSGCKLGLDTLGAKIKRGNIFAIKTIDINKQQTISNVIVTIIDPAGELPPIVGESSNIGFFSERLHEDYVMEYLIVQLEKEGCEDEAGAIKYFEMSYDDYKKAKGEEEGAFQLVLNMSERYEMKAISGTIKNALDEVVEGVEVKITDPSNNIITVQTNANGLFTFTPVVVGTFQLQGGKDDFQSTDLISIEVFQNKQYLIVIKVNGEQKAEYKKGDKLSFELRDENNTLLPLTIDATFAGLPLKFISGISDTVTFEDTSALVIPAIEGYAEQSLELTAKKTNWAKWLYWIVGILGVIALFIIIVLIFKKFKGSSGLPKFPKKGGIPKALQGAEINLGGE